MEQPSKKPKDDLGYGKPPEGGKFVAGNKQGRGRKLGSKNKPKPDILTSSEQVALSLAHKDVKEGVNLTGVEAVNLAQIKASMGGSVMAQDRYLRRIAGIEEKERLAREQILAKSEEYVELCWTILRRTPLEKRAEREANMLPHPDDIVIDYEAGTVRVLGPRNRREARFWEETKQALDDVRAIVLKLREQVEADPTCWALQREFTFINSVYLDFCDIMPWRHRPPALPLWGKSDLIPWWYQDAGYRRYATRARKGPAQRRRLNFTDRLIRDVGKMWKATLKDRKDDPPTYRPS